MIQVYLNKAMMWLLKCFLKLFLMKVLHFFFFFFFFFSRPKKEAVDWGNSSSENTALYSWIDNMYTNVGETYTGL